MGRQFLLLLNVKSWVIFLILSVKTDPKHNHWTVKAKSKPNSKPNSKPKHKLERKSKTKAAKSPIPWNKPSSRPSQPT